MENKQRASDLPTRTAWSDHSHLCQVNRQKLRRSVEVMILTPKVILRVPGKDVVFGNALLNPVFLRLQIWFQRVLGITLEVSDV